jgi:uncharacterized protein YaaW (UPF0174 family)
MVDSPVTKRYTRKGRLLSRWKPGDMSKGDELDTLLRNPRLTSDDWQALAEALRCRRLPHLPAEERILLANRKLRHAYGHVLVNLFRDDFQPHYAEILEKTAARFHIPQSQSRLPLDYESRVIAEVEDFAHEHIFEKRGAEEWESVCRGLREEVAARQLTGELSAAEADEALRVRTAVQLAVWVAAAMSGHMLYRIGNKVLVAAAKYLGIKAGAVVAAPFLGPTLTLLIFPVVWVVAFILFLVNFGNTSWKKVLPAVVAVAHIRGRLEQTTPVGGTNLAGAPVTTLAPR